MKRILFVIFACLSLCSYAQVPFNTEVVTGSFSSLKGQSANLEIVFKKIHGMTEAEFAETMRGLHSEFSQLNAEALKLQAEIDKNMKELFGEE